MIRHILTAVLSVWLGLVGSACAQLLPQDQAHIEQRIATLGLASTSVTQVMERLGYSFQGDRAERRAWPAARLLTAGYLEAGALGDQFLMHVAHGLGEEFAALAFEAALKPYFAEGVPRHQVGNAEPLRFKPLPPPDEASAKQLPHAVRAAILALSKYAVRYPGGRDALARRIRPGIALEEAFRLELASRSVSDFVIGVVVGGVPPPTVAEKLRNFDAAISQHSAASQAERALTELRELYALMEAHPPHRRHDPVVPLRFEPLPGPRHPVDFSSLRVSGLTPSQFRAAVREIPVPSKLAPAALPPFEVPAHAELPLWHTGTGPGLLIDQIKAARLQINRPRLDAAEGITVFSGFSQLQTEHRPRSESDWTSGRPTGPRPPRGQPQKQPPKPRPARKGVVLSADVVGPRSLRVQSYGATLAASKALDERVDGTHQLRFTLTDGTSVWSRPFSAEIVSAARAITSEHAVSLASGTPLVLVDVIKAPSHDVLLPEVRLHPVIAELRLGRLIAGADLLPLVALDLLGAQAKSATLPTDCVDTWRSEVRAKIADHVIQDAPVEIQIAGSAIYPLARVSPGVAPFDPARFLGFLRYQSAHRFANFQEPESVAFHVCLRQFVALSPELRALNDLVQAVGMMRWAASHDAAWEGAVPTTQTVEPFRTLQASPDRTTLLAYKEPPDEVILATAYRNFSNGTHAAKLQVSENIAHAYNAARYRHEVLCAALHYRSPTRRITPEQRRSMLKALAAFEGAPPRSLSDTCPEVICGKAIAYVMINTDALDIIDGVWSSGCLAYARAP